MSSHGNASAPLLSDQDDNRFLGTKQEFPPIDAQGGSFAEIKRSVSNAYALPAVIPLNKAPLTAFLLLNTMIGSGILNQPQVFKASGLLGGLIMFVIAACMTWLGVLLLTDVGVECNVLEYSGLATHLFGKRGEFVVDISIICLSFGALLGYILIVGATTSGLLESWGCHSDVCGTFWTLILCVIIFVSPFCLIRHFGHFAWLSIFSISTIAMVLLLVFIAGPMKQHHGEVNILDVVGTIRSTGSIVFSLSMASANFQAFISTEHKSRAPGRWAMITGSSILIGSLMCGTMGFAGYMAFRDDTQGEILENFDQHPYDFFKLMIVTHLVLYIPVNFVIMRYSIVKISTGRKSEDLPWPIHATLTVCLLVGTTIIVILLLWLGFSSGAAFNLILNVTGGIGGSLSSFILPAAMYLKGMKSDAKYYKLAILELIFGVYIMVSVVTTTIMDMA